MPCPNTVTTHVVTSFDPELRTVRALDDLEREGVNLDRFAVALLIGDMVRRSFSVSMRTWSAS